MKANIQLITAAVLATDSTKTTTTIVTKTQEEYTGVKK